MKIKAAISAIVMASLISNTALANPVRNAIFRPSEAQLSLEGLPPNLSIIEVRTEDNLTLKGVYSAPKDNMPIIVFFHGNAGRADRMMRPLQPIIDAGYGIISTEWRGYSGNPGSPSQEGVAKDADAFLKFAQSVAQGRRIIVLGHSLGGAVSLDLAQRHRLDALITYATILNTKAYTPTLARFLIRDPFDNKEAVRHLDEPFILIHGLNDETIPAAHGAELVKSAQDANVKLSSIFITGATHRIDATQLVQILNRIDWSSGTAVFNPIPTFDFQGEMPSVENKK